jgi:hypothetical protein
LNKLFTKKIEMHVLIVEDEAGIFSFATRRRRGLPVSSADESTF